MEILRRSPMFGILISIISAMALYDKFNIYAFIVGVPLIFSGIMLCSYEENLPEQWKVFCVALIFAFLSGLQIYNVISKPDPEDFSFTNENGIITLVRTWGKTYASIIETEHYGKFVVRTHFAEFTEGTKIKFDGSTKKFRSKSKNSDFDEGRYWKARGVKSWGNIKNVKEDDDKKFSFYGLRYKISRFLTIHTPKLTGEYLKAAWLGEHTKELDEKHRKWGTSHLLAVSGFHVGIVILCVSLIFGNNFFVMSLILWIYIILTGAAPSAMRAGLMLQIGILTKILGRRINGINSVSSAAVILLLFRPFLFWDIGFRLSVLTALTITSLSFWDKKILLPLISSIIFFVTFPQISYTFKGVPVAGILLNIFAPVYFSFAFLIASVIVFFKIINFPFSDLFLYSVEGIFLLWEKIADFVVNIIPYIASWNYFTAWTGTGILIFVICRYFNFSFLKTIILMIAMSFAAFVIFL